MARQQRAMAGYIPNGTEPANDAQAIVPSDSVDLPFPSRAIYVGVGGDIYAALDSCTNVPVLFKAVPQGMILPVVARRIFASSTSASSLLALF